MATSSASTASTSAAASQATPLVMRIIGFCALAHLINDLIQSVLPAIYPMLKANYDLSFAQIGLITLTFQITASLLQPWVGFLLTAGQRRTCYRWAPCARWWAS
ncbi:hypothetical protein GLGCALEP_00920 [Pseudomonas sp. MM221]|nr:hypothetical protein GLGCALEP_00920 [Pseudomonas sp. MM221]